MIPARVAAGWIAALLLSGLGVELQAQRGRGGPPAAPPTARATAPTDLTGTWISLITEDWRVRMAAPRKGERAGIPLNQAGITALNAWDPVKDEAAGEACRGYGAPGVMRAPGRLRITWADDATLKIETEAGAQTRLLHFAAAADTTEPSWQGMSRAEWEFAGGRRGRGPAQNGSLKIVTSGMRSGYLQKNGIPYGEKATLTEYISRSVEQNGDSYLFLTAIVEDPQYLNQPFIRSSHFRKEPATAAWEPEPCSVK